MRKKSKPGACVPRAILLNPPIQHRHTPARLRYLHPDQFAVAIGAAIAARTVLVDVAHRRAYKDGQKWIAKEKKLAQQFRSDLQTMNRARARGEDALFPARHHAFKTERVYARANSPSSLLGRKKYSRHRPITLDKALKAAGKEAYRQRFKELLKEPPPDEVVVEITRRGLLLLAGLQDDGDNYYRLPTTLDRLKLPIGPKKIFPPVLKRWQKLPSGRLQLSISGAWLGKPFGRLPWPPPMRSPTVLALYLFLNAINTRNFNARGITFEKLNERLGISTKWGGAVGRRIFDRALAAVNAHLSTLDHEALADANVKTPTEYKIEPFDDGERIRIVGISYEPLDPELVESVEDQDRVREFDVI